MFFFPDVKEQALLTPCSCNNYKNISNYLCTEKGENGNIPHLAIHGPPNSPCKIPGVQMMEYGLKWNGLLEWAKKFKSRTLGGIASWWGHKILGC